MALGDEKLPGGGGVLFVGTRATGVSTRSATTGRRRPRSITIASGLNMPNGVAVKDGALYVAEVNA
jgi:hypothetical protein